MLRRVRNKVGYDSFLTDPLNAMSADTSTSYYVWIWRDFPDRIQCDAKWSTKTARSTKCRHILYRFAHPSSLLTKDRFTYLASSRTLDLAMPITKIHNKPLLWLQEWFRKVCAAGNLDPTIVSVETGMTLRDFEDDCAGWYAATSSHIWTWHW